jgi:hypothetical protein
MNQIYPITPVSGITIWFFLGIIGVILALATLFGWFYYKGVNTTVAVGNGGLRIDAAFYGRTIPLSELQLAEARVIDLTQIRELNPKWRTNGLGLPGYQAGWFKLRNKQKALMFVTDRHRVVYLPTTNKYVLMLSMERPERFLDALRLRAGTG